jgi:D-3-phosphoglycerate dehydrogenase
MIQDRPRILLAEPFDDAAVDKLRAIGQVELLGACDEATIQSAVTDCDALLVRTRAIVGRATLESAKRLRVIGRGGVGLENIDLAAARQRGVIVVYTPGAATEAVADLTVGLMIAIVRNFRGADESVRRGDFWEARERSCARELAEMTLGIIGLGRVGRAVARRCRRGLGMPIIYNDIVAPGWLDFTATPVNREELYAAADVISLHVPLDESTRNMIDVKAIAQIKRGAFLLNTSRGAVVDNVALAKGLTDGRLSGAALDVFDPEPPPANHPLMHAPNTLFTPHIGARTTLGLRRMNDVVDDVIAVLQGRPPLNPA